MNFLKIKLENIKSPHDLLKTAKNTRGSICGSWSFRVLNLMFDIHVSGLSGKVQLCEGVCSRPNSRLQSCRLRQCFGRPLHQLFCFAVVRAVGVWTACPVASWSNDSGRSFLAKIWTSASRLLAYFERVLGKQGPCVASVMNIDARSLDCITVLVENLFRNQPIYARSGLYQALHFVSLHLFFASFSSPSCAPCFETFSGCPGFLLTFFFQLK